MAHAPSPPSLAGWPLIGCLPALLPNPLPFIQSRQQRFGNVFSVPFAWGRRSLFVLGPHLTEQVLVTQASHFSNRVGYEQQRRWLGEHTLLFADGDAHKALRREMTGAFKPERLAGYLTQMVPIVQRHIRGWSQGQPIDTQAVAMDIAACCIAGLKGDEVRFLDGHFRRVLQAMVGVLPAVPGSKARRGKQSISLLKSFFQQHVRRRRARPGNDLFSMICQSDLPTEVMVDNLLGLLVASYETTASALAFVLLALAEHGGWQGAIRDELKDLSEASYQDNQLLLHAVLNEALRRYSPLSYVPRAATADVALEGYRVPAGTQLMLAPRFTHHMDSIYPEPLRFDPTRFLPPRSEHLAATCAFMPFGKGAHTCLGMHFARLEVVVLLANLLPEYALLSSNDAWPRLDYVPVLRPCSPLPLTLRRLDAAEVAKPFSGSG